MIKIEPSIKPANSIFTKENLITDGKIVALVIGTHALIYLSGNENAPCYSALDVQDYSRWKQFTGKVTIES